MAIHDIPTALLAELRTARAHPDRHTATLNKWGLRPLTGGRNNDVYAWHQPDGHSLCIKLYRRTDHHRVDREWHGLTHVRPLDCAPAPAWLDPHPQQPAIAMTLLPEHNAPDAPPSLTALTALADTTRRMQRLPLTEPLARWPRVDSVDHYIARLTDVWPAQLAQAPHDPDTPTMLALLNRWERSNDRAVLAQPTPRVFSRGDANLLNWNLSDRRALVVDFEYAGYSDPAVDAADHTEHISARAVPDHTWHQLEPHLGIDKTNRCRYHAAQRTIALRWLAVLWKQRHRRPDDYHTQHARVQSLYA